MLLVREIGKAHRVDREAGTAQFWNSGRALGSPPASDSGEDDLPSQGGAWMTRADREEECW